MQIDFVRLATPDTMTRDAYRELCWGLNLPETSAGYGLLCGHHTDGRLGTAVLDDVEYARLLAQSGGGVVVPAEKAVARIDDWPDLRPSAASVWD
ncbi:hypothetical protein ACFWM0_14915 [Streptomyces sp. NPDC058405]|uniref:hypothetical protein n=1 Tax=Streptomyces sp. NPDC058405 TaxID=3346482 RepID=UPI0036627A62